MTRNYCIHCGVEQSAGNAQLVCGDCAAWLRDGQARYTLLWDGSRSEGPLGFSQVVERLERGLLGARDRISGRGSGYARIDQHPDFAPFFIPGDPRFEKLGADRAALQREQGARVRGRAAARLTRVALVAALLLAPLVVWKSGVLDAHQESIDAMKAKASALFARGTQTVRKAVDEDVALEELRQNQGLPAEDLVSALSMKYEGASGSVVERLDLARVGLLQGTGEGLEAARRELDYALVLEPQNVEVLTAMAVVYTRLASTEPDMGSRGLAWYARALAIEPENPALLRASAGMALASGGYEDAVSKAAKCLAALPDDPLCSWYSGDALAHVGRYDDAVRALGQAAAALNDAPAVQLALARARVESFHYGGAAETLEAFAERYPSDVGIRTLLARLYRDTGRFDDAARAAARAAELDPTQLDVRILRGQLLHHALGKSAEARTLLVAVAEDPAATKAQRQTALLHASLAARAAGDGAGALSLAQQLTTLAPGWGPGQMALARAALATGDTAAVDAALKDVDDTSMSEEQAARFHLEASRLFSEMDRARPASFEITAAKELRPGWALVRVAEADTMLDLENGGGAVDAVLETWWMDVEQDAGRDPIVEIPITGLSAKAVAEHMRAKIPAGSAVGQRVPLALGALEAIECLGRGVDCSRADAALDLALQTDERSPAAMAFKARIDVLKKRAEQAVKRLEVLAAGNESHPAILALLMQAKGMLALPAEVDTLFTRAGRLAPDGTLLLWRHSLALEALGQRDAAIAAAVEAVRADPGNLRARMFLLEKTGK